jgi:cytochrome c oxidase subunit 6a
MKKEAIEHLKARLSKQKEIEKGNHIPHEEEMIEMAKWIKISFIVAVPVCVLSVAKDMFLDHPHRKEGPEPDYMRIRKKEFPWECSDCELFNGDCWKKCREEKAAEGN